MGVRNCTKIIGVDKSIYIFSLSWVNILKMDRCFLIFNISLKNLRFYFNSPKNVKQFGIYRQLTPVNIYLALNNVCI